MMGRIINMEAALSGLAAAGELSDGITLKVTDQACPWNEGVYSIFTTSKTSTTFTTSATSTTNSLLQIKKSASKAELTLDIAQLTSLFWGFCDVDSLCEATESVAVEKLASLFSPCKNWMSEMS